MLHTTGLFPSEFDPTTNALLRTIQEVMDVSEEELIADQHFLADVMLMIGEYQVSSIPMEQTVHVMDMAYIGLLYHRHIPFLNEDTNEKVLLSADDPAGYGKTFSMLATALVQQQGVTPEQIMDTASDAATEAAQHLRQPDTLDREGLRLHMDFIALCMIGLMVHRLIPTTDVPPQ